MAKILNIETATDICSVSIADGLEVLATKRAAKVYQHASVITILIEECTKVAGVSLKDLDAIAVSSGPGSYTALRVGTATAKGICYALNKPLIAVDTLKALAEAARRKYPVGDCFISMIDARRMEVYAKIFDAELQTLADVDNRILDASTFEDYFKQYDHVVFAGNGAPKSEVLFAKQGGHYSEVFCDAEHMVPLSFATYSNRTFADIAYYAPLYFKAPNITRAKKIL
jgi:tRNA threonylcarbamoyladenosine biosynthesis protein TsaB